MSKNRKLVEEVVSDYTSASVSPGERALLDFAVKLTREPWASTEADITALRAAEWTDSAILDLIQIVAYFNFVNRLAHGLGVSLEEGRSVG